MKLFPLLSDVFEQPGKAFKTVFFPLLTIDLDELNQEEGLVHFVSVWGNTNPDPSYRNNFIDPSHVKFGWTGEKYIFKGDFTSINNFHKLNDWYKEAEDEYQEHKENYLKGNSFEEVKTSYHNIQNIRRKKISFEYHYYVKGLINFWLTRDKYFETGKFVQGGAYLDALNAKERKPFEVLNFTGNTPNPNQLVGSISGINYTSFGEDEIALYLNRKKKEVTQQFNWK